MELVDMRCPLCMGRVVAVGGGMGECESCGTRFRLSQTEAGSGAASPKSPRDFAGFDFDGFFSDFLATLDPDKSYDFSCGSQLNDRKGRKRIRAAREHFGVGADERVYFVYDSTLLGSCKKGFALAEGGFYCCDEADRRAHLSWDEFARTELTCNEQLDVGPHRFTSSVARAHMLYDLLSELQG